MSGIPLPPLHQGVVDDGFRDRWLADLAEHAELLDVRIKGGATTHAPEGTLGLGDAARLLRSGSVRAMQVRYRHAGATWCDTAIALGAGATRIVRIDESTIIPGDAP